MVEKCWCSFVWSSTKKNPAQHDEKSVHAGEMHFSKFFFEALKIDHLLNWSIFLQTAISLNTFSLAVFQENIKVCSSDVIKQELVILL